MYDSCYKVNIGGWDCRSIRRLNMMGSDILIRNGEWHIIGDIYWGMAADIPVLL